MEILKTFINEQGFVVLDGGLATELEKRGESIDHDLWSAKVLLSSPEKIADVHYAYFLAGADVAITASYQATVPGLQAAGLAASEAERVIRRSVSLAEEARARFWGDVENRVGRLRPLIAASVGPYGAFLHDGSEYRGNYGISLKALEEFHRERLMMLADSGADLLACETIPSLLEARALVELFSEFKNVQAWISFSCKDGTHISDGAAFSDAVAEVCQCESVIAAGLNCTPPQFVTPLLDSARGRTNKPFVVYPNSGELYDIATRGWLATSELGIIEQAVNSWHERGALLIGGCCRTTPETIRRIRGALTGAPAGSGNK